MMKKGRQIMSGGSNLWTVFLFIAAFSFGAFAADYNITVDAGTVLRADIPSTMFNGYLVHHKATISGRKFWDCTPNGCVMHKAGSVSNAINAIGFYGVRFPGGTAADDWYDFYDQAGVDHLRDDEGCPNGHGNYDTVTNVLQWCKDCYLKPYFTVPVKRFWPDHYGLASNYAYNVVSMVTNCEQQLGAPNVEYWDIGNELYESGGYDSTTYAEFAGRIACAIKNADSSAKPVVCVQRDNPDAAEKIVNKLQTHSEWWDSVDGVTFHILNKNMQNVPDNEFYEQATNMMSLFPGKELLVDAIATGTNGIISADSYLYIYEQILRAGVTHATCWPTVHYNTPGRAWVLESDGTEHLTPSGQALNWLISAANSNNMVSCSDTSGGAIKTMAFRDGDSKLTLFIMGKWAGAKSLKIIINGFSSNHVHGSRLQAYGGDVESDAVQTANANPAGTNPYFTSINSSTDYEILKLEFTP